ncbi:MAG: PH domain-containing protein [Acidobacteria bacterium]|nr:PH domain-containing protein [Acidobacteriota bacterium]
MTERIFPIIPGGSGVSWVIVPVLILLLAGAGFLLYVARSSRQVRFQVSSQGLRISGDIYGRLVPAGHLKPALARTVNLNDDPTLQPAMRTNGTGLPGYSAGWFRLRSGEKALLFVTDRTRVAYVPTSDGYTVLMSTPEPAALIKALREIQPAS